MRAHAWAFATLVWGCGGSSDTVVDAHRDGAVDVAPDAISATRWSEPG